MKDRHIWRVQNVENKIHKLVFAFVRFHMFITHYTYTYLTIIVITLLTNYYPKPEEKNINLQIWYVISINLEQACQISGQQLIFETCDIEELNKIWAT